MKTLVLGDIHHKYKWAEELIANTECDEIVFLGDYFDDWNDTPKVSIETAKWLKASLNDPKRIHLIGNHDMPYLVDVLTQYYTCPGWTQEKDDAVNSVLTKEDWRKLQPAYYTQGWLLSHAGFSYTMVAHPITGVPSPSQMVEEAARGLIEAKKGNYNQYFVAGYRMATPYEGGITWAHWDGEFIPIVDVPQIVGHTPATFVKARRVTKTHTDYCIDCHGAAAILITDGKAEVIRTGVKTIHQK